MKTLTERIHKRIFEHLYNTSTPVTAKNVHGVFNAKCFENAVQYASKHKGVDVVMGVIFYGEKPTLHFWNKKGEEHLETTLGYQCEWYKYYPQRVLQSHEWDNTHKIFEDGLDYYWQTFVKWYEKPFVLEGRVV